MLLVARLGAASTADRRRHSRAEVFLDGVIETMGSEISDVLITDVSQSGFQAHAPIDVPVNAAVVIEFAGATGPGLYQFNIFSPNLPPGDYLIEGTIHGVATQPGAFITLGPAQ